MKRDLMMKNKVGSFEEFNNLLRDEKNTENSEMKLIWVLTKRVAVFMVFTFPIIYARNPRQSSENLNGGNIEIIFLGPRNNFRVMVVFYSRHVDLRDES